MALEYFTVNHLSTKDLIRIFSGIKIDKAIQYNGTPCWIWQRALSWGYGHAWLKDTITSTHRIMYAWLVGPLPKGKKHGEIDHLCRRRACCNPLHLEFVPQQVNLARGNGIGATYARQTHCKRGHLLGGLNSNRAPTDPPHWRGCKQCIKDKYETNKLDPIWRKRKWEEARLRGQRKRAALKRSQSQPPAPLADPE